MEAKLTIDKAGRVVLPKILRDELHLSPGDTLELTVDGEQMTLRPHRVTPPLQKERGVWVFRTGEPLTAAETGHQVFATLHTSSASKTIDRIIDVFPAAEKAMVRSMLSESLRAVISQSLLKKVGGGRIAAHEIMVGIPAIRNLIREDKVAQMYSSIQTGSQYGMQTLDQCLQDLVKRGLVTRAAAMSGRGIERTAAKLFTRITK